MDDSHLHHLNRQTGTRGTDASRVPGVFYCIQQLHHLNNNRWGLTEGFDVWGWRCRCLQSPTSMQCFSVVTSIAVGFFFFSYSFYYILILFSPTATPSHFKRNVGFFLFSVSHVTTTPPPLHRHEKVPNENIRGPETQTLGKSFITFLMFFYSTKWFFVTSYKYGTMMNDDNDHSHLTPHQHRAIMSQQPKRWFILLFGRFLLFFVAYLFYVSLQTYNQCQLLYYAML